MSFSLTFIKMYVHYHINLLQFTKSLIPSQACLQGLGINMTTVL